MNYFETNIPFYVYIILINHKLTYFNCWQKNFSWRDGATFLPLQNKQLQAEAELEEQAGGNFIQ
jgi:hypothetical protein